MCAPFRERWKTQQGAFDDAIFVALWPRSSVQWLCWCSGQPCRPVGTPGQSPLTARRRRRRPGRRRSAAGAPPHVYGTQNGEWQTYGADLSSTRYSPLDQINAENFNKLEVAFRIKTEMLGPRPEYQLQVTPLMVKGVIYMTGRHTPRRHRRRCGRPARCCGCTA